MQWEAHIYDIIHILYTPILSACCCLGRMPAFTMKTPYCIKVTPSSRVTVPLRAMERCEKIVLLNNIHCAKWQQG